jgi:hypothetical protein
MPCACSAARARQVAARQQAAVDDFGCSVLTRPSSISGKPVCSATSVTGRPASRAAWRCRRWTAASRPARAGRGRTRATPVLSETEISAVGHGVGASVDELVVEQLAAQRVAVDAQPFGGAALVAFGAASSRPRAAASRPREGSCRTWPRARRREVLEVASRLSRMHSSMCFLLMRRAERIVGCVRPWPAAGVVIVGQRIEPVVQARTCAAQSSSGSSRRGRPRRPAGRLTAQPMCLRALRTPASSPYRP